MMENSPILAVVVPCYKEEAVLHETHKRLSQLFDRLIQARQISPESYILYVNDGSTDQTWAIIKELHQNTAYACGLNLAGNVGHQNALLAGLNAVKERCEIAISIDADLQDDIQVIPDMINSYKAGNDIVYGVRKERKTDTFFKRNTALVFYRLMKAMGVKSVYNHADYRLISTRVLESFSDYREVNIFLRGMVPLVGYPSDTVYYERHERLAGESHYPLSKMLALAFDGITSLSNKPIRLITGAGIVVSLISFIGVIWAIVQAVLGSAVAGWASTICIVCFMGGVQLVCLGVIGEYVGKIYMETKARPRYIISERTWAPYERKYHG